MSSARYEFRKALVEALRADSALSGVQVEHGWPGDQQERECIFLTETTGSFDVPVFTGQPSAAIPLHYDDEFDLTVNCLAWKPDQTSEEADARADEFALAVERVMREDPALAADTAYWVVIAGTLTAHRSLIRPSKEGFLGQVEIDVHVHVRISGPAE